MSRNRQTKKLVTPVRWFAKVSNGQHLSVTHACGSEDKSLYGTNLVGSNVYLLNGYC